MRPELQPGAFSPSAPPPPRKGGELAEWTLRLPWPFPGLLPAPSWHLPSSLPGGEAACSPLLLMPLPSPLAGAALEPAAWPSHFPHRAQENPPPESHPPPGPPVPRPGPLHSSSTSRVAGRMCAKCGPASGPLHGCPAPGSSLRTPPWPLSLLPLRRCITGPGKPPPPCVFLCCLTTHSSHSTFHGAWNLSV